MGISLLNYPMSLWDMEVNQMTREQIADVERSAADLAERAARLSGYLSMRWAATDHGKAVEHQNKVARDVRKALGYTLDAPITF